MSVETDGLIRYMQQSGVPHLVTDISTPGVHAPASYHYAAGTGGIGLAIDVAGPTASWDSPQLQAVYQALEPLGPLCAELIYRENQWKNGRRVAPYDSAANIHTHVHIAMPRGWHWDGPVVKPPNKERAMYDPALTLQPIVADLACPTGGVWLAAADGSVYAFGGAPYNGGANGKPYFAGRSVARLELVGSNQYKIIALSGEMYGPTF